MDDALSRGSSAAIWRVELLGQVRARRGEEVIVQFGSRKIAALLARLALAPRRAHAREELIDLLWPEADLDTGRNRLRQALATLRRLIEPPGIGDVLLADRQHVRLLAGVVSCDVVDFESAVARRDWPTALALYVGELMPGHYEEWVIEHRGHLATLAEKAAAAHADGAAQTRALDVAAPSTGPALLPTTRLSARQTWFPDRWTQIPAYASQFFGRSTERADLRDALVRARLVTVKGPGGAGKTRFATEAARDLATQFELTTFVPLADCAEVGDVPARVAAALPIQGGARDSASVLTFLRARSALLILDNFEQLVSATACALLESWLQALPALHLIVTSRRRLDVDGEHVLPMEHLELPEADATPAQFAEAPAAALFVDRARRVRPAFALNEHNRDDVLAVCRLAEGLPLAIELAASRAHAFSVAAIAAQLSRCVLDLQRGGGRSAREPRHASLRATLAWSWTLLDEQARRALVDLTVFGGGCTLEAAAAVLVREDAAALLASLVDDALVLAESDVQGRVRYRLYDMVREFALEQAPADATEPARLRHWRWCLSGLQARSGDWPADEVENLYAAMRGALSWGRPQATLELAVAAERHWSCHSAMPAILQVWRLALQACDSEEHSDREPAAVLKLDARRLLARRCFEAGEGWQHALELAAAAVDEARRLDSADALCRALVTWASIRWSGEPSSSALWPALDEAAALRGQATPATCAALLNLVGEVHLIGDNDPAAARDCYEEAMRLFRHLRWHREALAVEVGLGICAQYERRYDVARSIQLRVAAGAAELDDRMLQIDAENNLCVIATLARDWLAALHHGRRQLALAARWNARYMQAMALWNLAKPLARARLPEAAAQVMSFAADDWVRHYGQLRERDRRYLAKVDRLIRAQIGAARTDANRIAGLSLTMTKATRLAQDASR